MMPCSFEKSISQNYKAAALLPNNKFTRQKILRLIDTQNFDVTTENLALLYTYTYEDVQLVENLVKSKQYDNLAQLFDGAGTCVDITLNSLDSLEEGWFRWLVIQSRRPFGNPRDFFFKKNWEDYAKGFGKLGN